MKKILISQSIREIVENNSNYKKEASSFKSGNSYIQPDIIFITETNGSPEILEICEIKVIEKGNLDFFIAQQGAKNNCEKFKKGDFCRLFGIKSKFPKIRAVALIVDFSFGEEANEVNIPEELKSFMGRKSELSYDIYKFYIFEIKASERISCDRIFKKLP